jgi:hypothetical protein
LLAGGLGDRCGEVWIGGLVCVFHYIVIRKRERFVASLEYRIWQSGDFQATGQLYGIVKIMAIVHCKGLVNDFWRQHAYSIS